MSVVADGLNRAADLIERDGWVQRQFYDRGRRCLDGAIMAALASPAFWRERRSARELVEEAMGGDLYEFNDTPGRTQAEVVAALRAAAERAA